MTTRMTRITGGLSVLALCWLAGCHIWVDEVGDNLDSWWYYCDDFGCYRCDSNGCRFPDYLCESGDCGSVSLRCAEMRDCDGSQICASGRCQPGPRVCRQHADCGDGAYCDDGRCVASGLCSPRSGCNGVGDNLSCDDRGCCVPGPQGPQACKASSDCGEGGICVDGRCGSCSGDCGGGETCELDRHCGEGRGCVDGQCVNSCTNDNQCGSTQVCNVALGLCTTSTVACDEHSPCDLGSSCVNGACYLDCTSDGVCANAADTCSDALTVGDDQLNLCVAEHAASPQCTLTRDCTDNEQCVNGICRTMCAEEVDCANCDDGPVCGKGGFCMTSAEATPECKSNEDCLSGSVCHDTRCVAL